MQNIKNILPNLSLLDLDQQDINKLGQLFNNSSNKNKRFNSSMKITIQPSDEKQQTIRNGTTNTNSIQAINTSKYVKQNPSLNLLNLLTPTSTTNINMPSINPKIKQITSQTLSTISKHRQSQLLSELQYLKQQLSLLQNHLDNVNSKYQEKREQANLWMVKCVEFRDQNEEILAKFMGLDAQYSKRQKDIRTQLQDQNKNIKNQLQRKITLCQLQITSLTQINSKLQQMLLKSEAEVQNLSTTLQNERNINNLKQNELNNYNEQLVMQLDKLKQHIVTISNKLATKTKQCIQKDQKLQSLQKTVKQVNYRMVQIEKDTKRQLLKQRSITKKAIDGLQMTRKYSEMELNKSRRKEKQFMEKQKQLINLIKDICKQKETSNSQQKQNNMTQKNKNKLKLNIKSISMADTVDQDISSKKSEVKSLNTTLKLTKNKTDNINSYSPFVSNFMVDDSQQLNSNVSNNLNNDHFNQESIIYKNEKNYEQSNQNSVIYHQQADKQTFVQYGPNQKFSSNFNFGTNKLKNNSKSNSHYNYIRSSINYPSNNQNKNQNNGSSTHRSNKNEIPTKQSSNLIKANVGVQKNITKGSTDKTHQNKNISITINKNKNNIKKKEKKQSPLLNIDINFQPGDSNYYSLNSTTSLAGSGTPCFQVHTSKSSNYRNLGLVGLAKNQHYREVKASSNFNQH